MQSNTFVEDLRSGKAKIEDLNKYVERYHDSDDNRTLEEYLGLKEQELVDWVVKSKTPMVIIEAAKQGRVPLKQNNTFRSTFIEDLRNKKTTPLFLASYIERWHNSDDPRSLEEALGITEEELKNWSVNHIVPSKILEIEDQIQKTSEKIERLKARARNYKAMLKMSKKDK